MGQNEPNYKLLGLVTIATNKYVEYWKQLLISIFESQETRSNLEVHLFTDQVSEIERWISESAIPVTVKICRIPDYRWPEATLKRFDIISQHKDLLTNDYLFYLDADMIVSKNLNLELQPYLVENQMNFVPHPGYVLGDGILKKLLVLGRPKKLAIFLRNFGSLGDWETNPKSSAYVQKKNRKIYLHGAFWGGSRDKFFEFIDFSKSAIQQDEANGVIARWHDESHLNKYFSEFSGNILPSKFSWYKPYKRWLPKDWTIESVNNYGKTR